ncbi:MAG: hypothetical protein FJ265_12275 [Planctomycetes bacterium]|nr:hypothetical protein [Planctomycetota bacterium]
MLHRRTATLFCLLFTAYATAQATPAPAPAPAAPSRTLRVHIVGASVSGGFEDGPLTGASEPCDTVPLLTIVKAWAGDEAKVTMHNPVKMLAMFTDPQKLGEEQVQAALKQKPDLVLAVDFPFWFGYGFVQGDEAKARSENLAVGLGLLARFQVPVLLGDLPDMHGAAARMLHPRQIPSREVLQQLNRELAAFVAARPNLRIVPLAQTVRTMKDEGVVLPLRDGAVKTPPGALLQQDRLHATRLGMAMLGHELQGALGAAFPKDHPLHSRRWSFEQFVEAAGAGDDLAAVREAVAPKQDGGR